MMAILTGVRSYLVVLILISLIISDVECVFMHWLAISMSSLDKKVYLGLPPIFWSGCLFFDIEPHEPFVYFGD